MNIKSCGCLFNDGDRTIARCKTHQAHYNRNKAKIAERRELTDRLYYAARNAYQFGRAHRVEGIPPSNKWREDFYYMAGYNGAGHVETLQSAAQLE